MRAPLLVVSTGGAAGRGGRADVDAAGVAGGATDGCSADAPTSCPFCAGPEGPSFLRTLRGGFGGCPGQEQCCWRYTHLAHAVRFFTSAEGFQHSAKPPPAHALHLNRCQLGRTGELQLDLRLSGQKPHGVSRLRRLEGRSGACSSSLLALGRARCVYVQGESLCVLSEGTYWCRCLN